MQGEPVCSLVAPDPCRACRLAGWLRSTPCLSSGVQHSRALGNYILWKAYTFSFRFCGLTAQEDNCA